MSAFTKAMRRMRPTLLGGLMLLTGLAHAGTVTYVYTDPQGTPLAEADASGNITATFDYAPYGSQVLGTPPDGPGYTGHMNDPDTGLVYMQARYYDPAVGRFLSTDPVGPSPGNTFNFNRYDYAGNNPVNNIDPNGKECTGSHITDGNGNCASTGTSLAGSGSGATVQVKKPPPSVGSRIADVAIGVGKAIVNGVGDALDLVRPPDPGDQHLHPSNSYQAAGMVGGGIVVGAAEAAASDGDSIEINPEATAPVGRLGSPMDVPRGTNAPGSVGGIEYSGHAFDQMQGRGLTPSVVRNTIEHGASSPGRNGATVHYDSVNNTTVITNQSGRVITVYPGGG